MIMLAVSRGYSQEDLYETVRQKFPDAPAAYVERSEVLNLTVDGDSLRIQSQIFEDMLHLKDQTDAFSGRRVYGSHFTKIKDLKAKTLVRDKNKYKEIHVQNFARNSDHSSGIFYDDSYYYAFDFPAVAAKNRTQLEYTETHVDPKFVTGFVFASYVPQSKTSFVIKTTGEVDLMYQVLNDPGKQIQFKKYVKGKTTIYEWSAENLPALKSEDDSPSIRYYAPHLILYVKSFKTKNKDVKVLGAVNDLYAWYYGFVKDLNTQPNTELKSIVDGIVATSKSEIEIVKNVFYWVQQNIQYVAFEQGMRGLIPHPGSYVCEKRYGDCKDMANLIVNMLSLANVKAYHTWIGTRNLPYKYSDVPTPLVDDHMIATYIGNDGQYYFLDATSDYTAFGYPSSMIQGKEALIGKGPDQFEIKSVPVIDRKMNLMTDSMALHIDTNVIVGSGSSSLTGYPKVFGGYELDRAEQDDVKKYVTRLVGKGSNKFFLDQYTLSNLENRDKPTTIKYDFRISDYFQTIGDEIYINLNLNKDFYNSVINTETRKSPKELDYAYTKYEFIELTLPEGYSIEYLPENSKNDGKLLGHEITYQLKGNKILFSKKLYVDYLLMQPTEFVSWNSDVKKVSEAYKESIIIKKKK
jgi:transglutaminase-like putative cysteine protease